MISRMATPVLPGFLGALAPVLNHYGYLAVGGLVLVEDFGVPAPGETVLIAAAVYAGAGQLNIVLVALIAFVAAVLGDNIGFAIGHFGGRPLAERLGRYVFLTPERLDAAERFFTRHGGKVVTIARFVEGLRQANGIIAGITGMHWLKFLAYNALGAALWVGLWVTLGDLAGNHITPIYDAIHQYTLYVLIAFGVLVVALIVRHLVRRRDRTPKGPASTPSA
jgi:membrane protein DedA with SNARE-associated domain